MSLSARTSSWTIEPPRAWVAGTVHSEGSLRAACALGPPPAAPDLLELRIDHFAGNPDALDSLAVGSARPLIITVRRGSEGGHGMLDPASRRDLYERFLPSAQCADLELSALAELAPIAEKARQTSGGLIASHHDFHSMPGPESLRELAGRACDAGASLFKVAARVETPRELMVLLDFLAAETRLPLAVMGMGRLGRVSRLAAAALGSRLNYGYLGDEPQVPGQWPAAMLRARIDELSQGEAARAAVADVRGIAE